MTRRTLLHLTVAGAVGTTVPAYAEGVDYTARKTFDDWDRLFQKGGPGQPDQPNDNSNRDGRSGMLAWSQSYVLLGLVRMYETYRDTYYLDRLIDNVDQVLGVRDSARGVTDYRGLSLPAWRADHPYTTGYATLADGNGRPLLDLREALSYAEDTTVTVSAGSRPDTFTVRLDNTSVNRSVTHTDLSLDPGSPDYAVTRIYAAAPGPLQLTASDRGSRPGDVPAFGSYQMHCKPVIFAVHTGMITYPIAAFVRIVASSPVLRKRYWPKASEYLSACREAVAVHDWEYRMHEDDGYLAWPKTQPLPYDGCEQPINQSVGLGQTLVELALVTGDPEYRAKVAAMGRMLAAQLTVDSGDAYVWHYWPTGGHIYDGFAKTGEHPERRCHRPRRPARDPHHRRRRWPARRPVGRRSGTPLDAGDTVGPAGACSLPGPLQPQPADAGTRRPTGHRLRLAPGQRRLLELGSPAERELRPADGRRAVT